MKELLIIITILNILFIFSYFVINTISNKTTLDIDIPDEISKQLQKLNLKTKIEVLDKVKPNYDLEEDKIEINKGNNIKTLSESFHELGHSFFNHFYNHKVYDKDGEIIKYTYKEIDFNFKLGALLGFLFTKSILLGLIFTLFGVFLEINTLMLLGTVCCLITAIMHTINLIEEIKATKIARQIIKFEKFLSKKEELISNICLSNALYTYIFITALSYLLIIINLYTLFNIYMK